MLHKLLKNSLFIIGILHLTVSKGYTQQSVIYPVQLNVQLLPPYTPCLSDYLVGDFNRLRVIALQRDMSKPNYRFSLKVTIKSGNSVVLQSKISPVNWNNFTVYPGASNTISGPMLSNLFHPDNLDRAPNGYSDNGWCLPQGAYELVFQAFDSNTNMPVSDIASTVIYLSLSAPPYPLTPANGSCLNSYAPLILTWTDAAAGIRADKRYKLEIYEVPSAWSYQQVARQPSMLRITEGDLTMPFYQALPAAGMEKGKRYAWRVQIYNDNPSGVNTGAYTNGGYSEMRYFDFDDCPDVFGEDAPKKKTTTDDKPVLIRIDTSGYTASAVWKEEEKYLSYFVEYRKKGAEDVDWMRRPASKEPNEQEENTLNLTNINRGVIYEVRVQGKLEGDTYSQYSDTTEFILEKEKPLNCGDPVPPVSSTDQIEALFIGDIIYANGYEVEITHVRKNSDGAFAGYGVVNSPIISALKLKVKFDGIKVNTAKELQAGRIVTVYRESTSATLDLNGVLNKGATGLTLEEQAATLPVRNDVYDGATLTDPADFNTIVKDSEGNVYAVDAAGNVQQVGKIDPKIKYEEGSLSTAKGKVTFDIIDGQNMIIDKNAGCFANYLPAEKHYETISGYQVAWAPLPTGLHKKIQATIENLNGYVADSVKFVCSGNVVLNSRQTGDKTFEIDVFGGDSETSQSIYAVVRENEGSNNYATLGKLSMAHYEPKTKQVMLVPVGRDGSTIKDSEIETQLNAIFSPAGITFHVSVDERFDVDNEYLDLSDGLQVEGSGTWTNETDEMKALKYLYKQERTIDPHTAYLFVLEKAENQNVQGDMPRGKQAGYIFAGNGHFSDGRLVAHELGHGVFNLEHTDAYGVSLTGGCNNLMGYNATPPNTHLTVWQWDRMYHPGIVWNFLEGDEDGMLKSISMTDRDFLYVLNSINTDTLFTFNTLNIPIRQIDSLELNVKYIDQELVSNEK